VYCLLSVPSVTPFVLRKSSSKRYNYLKYNMWRHAFFYLRIINSLTPLQPYAKDAKLKPNRPRSFIKKNYLPARRELLNMSRDCMVFSFSAYFPHFPYFSLKVLYMYACSFSFISFFLLWIVNFRVMEEITLYT